jgi:GT2 family glycosyltransferase
MVVERQMIEIARNGIALEGLQKKSSHVLFLDDDNPVPPDTLEKLLEADKDIVIAPILTRNPDKDGNHSLCAFYSETVDGKRIYRNVTEFRDKGPLHRIDGGGTGCMLIKTTVLAKMFSVYSNRWFERTREVFEKPIVVDGKEYTERTMSEDVLFCERAVDLGFEIWLDERIRPLHISGHKYVVWQPGM